MRDFATILSTLQNNTHHRPPSLVLCLPNVVHVTARLKRSIEKWLFGIYLAVSVFLNIFKN